MAELANSPVSPKTAALLMLAYAEVASVPRTRAAARACNRMLSRTRDFLMHAPGRDLAVAGLPLRASEFEALRTPALAEMRARCQACGVCRQFGLTPP